MMGGFEMKARIRFGLLLLIGIWGWSCNLSDTSKPGTLTFHLNDSLKTASGKYDSIHLDLYTISGSDTLFAKTLFHGVYTDPGQLQDMPLGEGVAGNFVVRVVGFKNKQVALEIGVAFANGQASPKPIVYKSPLPADLGQHGPVFIAGLRNTAMAEGETRRIVVKAASDNGGLQIAIQNLDSLRSLFIDGANAISVNSAGDSLVLVFSPGSAKGTYHFRVALTDSLQKQAVQILIVSVGKVNRPPSLSLAPPDIGPRFTIKEGVTASLHALVQDPDSGNIAAFLPLVSPAWSNCGELKFDTVFGLLTFKPSFRCVVSGESTLADLILRGKDNGTPSEIGQLFIQFTVQDSNSAPRWKSASINLSAKEGAPITQGLSDLYIGDAENDSVEMTTTCGTLDRSSMKWSFNPGFRDAGQKDCEIVAADSHLPPATSKLTLKLSIADSMRVVDVAILNPLMGFATRDSLVVVKWKVGDQSQPKDTTENLKTEGLNIIRRSYTDSLGNFGADSIRVYLDTKPPSIPIISANPASPTNNQQPTWTWKSGGNGGKGFYRYKLGDENFSVGAFQGKDSSYKPSSPLGEGTQKLYVQEEDSVGNWSSTGSAFVIVDITSPGIPVVNVAPNSPTNNQTPIFSALQSFVWT